MYFVLFICCISVLFAFLDSKKRVKNGLAISFLILSIISSLRYDFGSDYMEYVYRFRMAQNLTISKIISLNSDIREPVWELLNVLFQPFGPFALIGFISATTCYIYYRFIKMFVPRNLYWIAVAIYVFNFDLFILQQSMIRQSFAMALIVLSFMILMKNKKGLWNEPINLKKTNKKDLVFICLVLIIAINIHTSSVIAIPALLLAIIPLRNGKIISVAIVVVIAVLWLSHKYVEELFVSMLNIEAILEYTEKYQADESLEFGIRRLFELIPVIVAAKYLFDNVNKNNNRPLVLFSLGGYVILPFATILQMISRMAFYFDIFAISSFPLIYANLKNRYVRFGLTSILFLIYIYLWLYKCQSPVWDGKFLHYKTIFEQI